LYRHLIAIARRGAIAALSCAGALATGLAVGAPGRAAVLTVQMMGDLGPVEPQGLSLAERNKMLAVPMLVELGWSSRQWKCLDRLWMRESGWNHRAHNRWSGAYGIPQALPGGKMRSAGTDWRRSAATQIKWGLGYIGKRYGSPCAAWGHSRAAGWY
jgi:hypothetical protein